MPDLSQCWLWSTYNESGRSDDSHLYHPSNTKKQECNTVMSVCESAGRLVGSTLRSRHWQKLNIFVYSVFALLVFLSTPIFTETQILRQNTCTETKMVKLKFVPYRKWTEFLCEELGRLLGSLPIYWFFWAIFLSRWLVCKVVLVFRTLFPSGTPYLF